MPLTRKQNLQWATSIYLVVPVLFFYLREYFDSDSFLSQYRLAPALQNHSLVWVAILLTLVTFVLVLNLVWTALSQWSTAQKILTSLLLFVYPLIVFLMLSLVHIDLKFLEEKEQELVAENIPQSNKRVYLYEVVQPKLFREEPKFLKTVLCTHKKYSPFMHVIGEYSCKVSDVVPQSMSVKVVFEKSQEEESDSLQLCDTLVVY